MRVLPATATTAIIACTDRVVILYMFNRSTLSSTTKNPGFKAGVRNFFFEQHQAFQDEFFTAATAA